MNMKRWAIALFGAAAIAVMAAPAHADTVVKVPNAPGTFDATVASGIISADRPAHPALTGASTGRNIPVASFRADEADRPFSLRAAVHGAQIVTDDGNRDRGNDVTLSGAPQLGWYCIEMPWGLVCTVICGNWTSCS
jgi:hypothetical protein